MEQMIVDVKVHPTVREFVQCTEGSDLLSPKPYDTLWLIVKLHLSTVPYNVPFLNDRTDYIRIALRKCNNSKIYTRKMKGSDAGKLTKVTVDTLFRCYLDEKGQNVVARHLRTAMKECFHNFVQGAVFDNPELTQKKAIENFCRIYNIAFNKISYDLFVKSWQRSPQKETIKNREVVNPLVF